MKHVGIGLIGVGGYGRQHLSAIAVAQARGLARLEAAVILPGLEPETESQLRTRGVKIYRSAEEMFERARGEIPNGLGLIGVPCGIAEHAPLSIAALEAGYHVLCEKPAAGTWEDARKMLEASKRSGRMLSIGFQNLYTPSIQRMKALVLEGRRGGRLGRLRWARSSATWPRDSVYYGRNSWAGRLAVNGRVVNDSPVQNALAHELQNLLWVAGPSETESASPRRLYGEQYRAKEIESADTQYLRVETDEGAVLCFAATHSCREYWGPVETWGFEHGTIRWDGSARGRTEITYADGEVERLDNGTDDIHALPYLGVLEAIAVSGRPAAVIENCIQHTACVDTLFRCCPITAVGGGHTRTDRGANVVISILGAEDLVKRMHEAGTSFHEAGAPWARKGVETVMP